MFLNVLLILVLFLSNEAVTTDSILTNVWTTTAILNKKFKDIKLFKRKNIWNIRYYSAKFYSPVIFFPKMAQHSIDRIGMKKKTV